MKKWNDLTPEEKSEFQYRMNLTIRKWVKLIRYKNKLWEAKNRILH